MARKKPDVSRTTFNLSGPAATMLTQLSEAYGIDKTGIVEAGIRLMASTLGKVTPKQVAASVNPRAKSPRKKSQPTP